MSEATKRVESILTSAFEMTKYVDLVREIFSNIRIIAPDTMKKEYSNFSSHVEASAHVGSYVSPENEKIAVFAVELKQQTYVENSRSTQRSFARAAHWHSSQRLRDLQEQKRQHEADAIMEAYLKSGKSLDEVMTFLCP